MNGVDRRGFPAAGAAAAIARALEARGEPPAGRPAAPDELGTAGIRLVDADAKYEVWTKRLGTSKTRMLTLHGGPSATLGYLGLLRVVRDVEAGRFPERGRR